MAEPGIAKAIASTSTELQIVDTQPPDRAVTGVVTPASHKEGVNFSTTIEQRIYEKHDPAAATQKKETEIATLQGEPKQDKTGTKIPVPRSKPSTGLNHGQKTKKQTLRLEFIRVSTVGEAFKKWSQVMKYIRDIDPSMIIHHQQDQSLHTLPHQTVPEASAAKPYAAMLELQNRS